MVPVEFVVKKPSENRIRGYSTMVVEEKSSESLRENQINDDTTSTEQKTYSLESILFKKILAHENCSVNAICYFLTYIFHFFFVHNYINFFSDDHNKKNNLNKCTNIKDIIKIIFYILYFYFET